MELSYPFQKMVNMIFDLQNVVTKNAGFLFNVMTESLGQVIHRAPGNTLITSVLILRTFLHLSELYKLICEP